MGIVSGRIVRPAEWAGALGVDCLMLALVLPGLVGRPTTPGGTLTAVLITGLVLSYWTVDILSRFRETGGSAKGARPGASLSPPVALPLGRWPRGGQAAGLIKMLLLLSILILLVVPPSPALAHADRLPGDAVLAALSALLPATALAGLAGAHSVSGLALAIVVGGALLLAGDMDRRMALLVVLALNPLFVGSLRSGTNDLLVLAEVMVVLVCARRGWTAAALLLLGLACATTYTILPAVPFVLLWIARRAQGIAGARRPWRALLPALARALGLVALPVALLIGPFLLWNTRAPWEGTGAFITGLAAHSGSLGYGFATFVVHGGLVGSAEGHFPFGVIQVLVGLPLLVLLLRRQARYNTLTMAMAGYATLYLCLSYLAPAFSLAQLAYGVALFALALFMGDQAEESALLCGSPLAVRLDFLVVLLLVPQILPAPQSPAQQLTAATVLLLIVVWAILAALRGGWPQAAQQAQPGEQVTPTVRGSDARLSRLQSVLLLLVIGLLVVWPAVAAVNARAHGKPYTYITDNALQVEYATADLLALKNPYASTYVDTPMRLWYADPRMSQALYHADELPLNLLLAAPVQALSQVLFGWTDARLLFLPLAGLTLLCLWWLGGATTERRARLAVFALGPFFVPALVYGDTDVVLVALLAAFFLALGRGRLGWSAVLMGAVLAAKQTAIFLYPLYLAYLWGLTPPGMSWRARAALVWRQGRGSLVIPALTLAPFLIWNAPAFWASTAGFVAGTVPHAYPIRGVGAYGFGAVVVLAGWVASAASYYPFTVVQVLFVGPLLVLCCRALSRGPSISLLLSCYAVVAGVGYFFSRFLQDGGVGYLVLLVALACLPGQVAVRPRLPARSARAVTAGEQPVAALAGSSGV